MTGILSALRSRDFRLLWLGQSASTIGDAMVIVAVALFVTNLTHDPGDVGLVLAAYAGPMTVFVVFGGVVADRLPRRTVMLTCDAVRGLLHGSLALLIVTGTVQMWHVLVIALLFGSAEAMFRPAVAGIVPQVVPLGDLQSAQALSTLIGQIARCAAPVLATCLVLLGGAGTAFGLDAVTFAISAALLARVRVTPGARAEEAPFLADLAESWRAVRSRVWVWATLSAFAAGQLLALAPFLVLGAHVADQRYGSAVAFGLANAFWGAGTVCGAALAGWWRPRHLLRMGLLVSAPWPLCIVVFALGPPVALVYAAMTVAGLGVGLFIVWWETVLASRIPSHLLSRVSAWEWLSFTAVLPLGYVLTRPIAELLGDTRCLVLGALTATTAAACALLPRTTRAMATAVDYADEPVPETAASRVESRADLRTVGAART